MKQHHHISRRDFLSTLAGIGLGVTLSTPSILAASQRNENIKSTLKMKNTILGKRKLGKLEVTELGFGCMNIAWAYGNPPAKADAVKLIRNAYEQGVRF